MVPWWQLSRQPYVQRDLTQKLYSLINKSTEEVVNI